SVLGLMGAVSRAAIQAGGEVIGVIPRAMVERGIENYGLTDVRIVGDMHERKAHMASLVDAFIALPGGYGTMEEIFEVVTWAQLGYHQKPCGFLNIAGYYDHLIAFLQQVQGQGFISQAHLDMVLWDETPASLLERFRQYRPPLDDKIASALQKTDEYNLHNGIHTHLNSPEENHQDGL
ncbi:MAG: TIGR00730 family Rossman fold protein, partial [Anaerolineaceae bacterium]